jgi:hypothetical protein
MLFSNKAINIAVSFAQNYQYLERPGLWFFWNKTIDIAASFA